MLSVGIWLLPIVPIALYEVRISRSRVRPALACSLTWCATITSYYLTNAVQLAFIGVPTRLEMHISNRLDPFFWDNWKSELLYDVGGSIVGWGVVALVGGFIIGFIISLIYLYLRKNPNFKRAKHMENS